MLDTNTSIKYGERLFTTLAGAVAAVASLESVQYRLTIRGIEDEGWSKTESADLEQEVTERGFDAEDGDLIALWLPLGHDMVTSS